MTLDFLELQPGERVLDLGCGQGLETIAAAELIGDSGLAVGLDLTPEMIRQAVENARLEKMGNIQFVVGDIEELLFEFEDESFEAIISNCAINHACNKQLVYREIYRILRPGGRIVISDATSRLPLPEHIKMIRLNGRPVLGERLPNGSICR